MLILHRNCIYIAKLSQNERQSNITVAIFQQLAGMVSEGFGR